MESQPKGVTLTVSANKEQRVACDEQAVFAVHDELRQVLMVKAEEDDLVPNGMCYVQKKLEALHLTKDEVCVAADVGMGRGACHVTSERRLQHQKF